MNAEAGIEQGVASRSPPMPLWVSSEKAPRRTGVLGLHVFQLRRDSAGLGLLRFGKAGKPALERRNSPGFPKKIEQATTRTLRGFVFVCAVL